MRIRSLLLPVALPFLFAVIAFSSWHPSAEICRATAIVVCTLVVWISEIAPLGIVALGIPVAATAAGLLTWTEALSSWGDPILFLFLGAFLLARALDRHGAFDRLVGAIAGAAGTNAARLPSGVRLAGLVLLLSGTLSTVQNNTAVTAMLLPLILPLARRTEFPSLALLALSFGATFGGMATPVGTAPNFLGFAAMKVINPSASFLGWMCVGVPVWVGTSLLAWGLLALARRFPFARRPAVAGAPGGEHWIESPVLPDVAPGHPPLAYADLSRPEHDRAAKRWAIAAFVATALVWLTCGAIMSFTPEQHPLQQFVRRFLPDSMIPIAAALLLFAIRTGPARRPVLEREDLHAIDWDTLFLIAGGLCLGRLLDKSGAAAALAQAVGHAQLPQVVMMLAIAGATTLLSELTSNTATAALMVPIAKSLAPLLGGDPQQAILLVALSASLGFALPVSTPPNAIVYGTRLIPLPLMVSVGLLVDVLSIGWVVACVLILG